MVRIRVLMSVLLAPLLFATVLAQPAAADPFVDPPDAPCVMSAQCEGAGFGFPPNPPPQDYGAGHEGLQQLITDAAIGIASGIGDFFDAVGTTIHDALDQPPMAVPCYSEFCA
jgi:hypothetical protein